MTFFLGIDGSGSSLRVVITDDDMQTLAQAYRLTVNPQVIGRTRSAMIIQSTMREALANSGLSPTQITGVGIGVAGATDPAARRWLRDVASSVTPDSRIYAGTDHEITLVGAHNARAGVLIASDLASVAYGINAAGKHTQVGGWGHLIGNEGSAYWIGSRALQLIGQSVDGRIEPTELTNAILRILNLRTAQDIVTWTEMPERSLERDIALLAPMVLDIADGGDPIAAHIIERASRELGTMVDAVQRRLGINELPVAFAGNLLEKPNRLSETLAKRLGLSEIPRPFYPPVLGAALLAKLELAKL